jgi:DHA2 family multidrug resistance protein-like MFS transporter
VAEGVGLATRREWIGLAVLALACLTYSMDLTVLNLAVPTLTRDLQPSPAQMLWIIDIYGFMVAGFLMTMGTLGDRLGRRRVLMIGAAAFGAASIVTAFSTSAEMLIVMRAVLGIAGATLAPSTLSLITVMFKDPKQRAFAISMWIASFSAGGIVGPVVGGVVLEYFHWGVVFLIAVPPMLLLLVLGPRLLPEYRAPDAGRIDLVSVLLSLGAVLGVIYGVKHAAEAGLTGSAIAAVLMGSAIGCLFVRRQRRLTDPMIDVHLFRIPAFSAALALNLIGVMVLFASFVFIAQYLQLVVGLSPLQAGLWSLPSAFAFTVGSFATPALVGRMREQTLVIAGLALCTVGFGVLAFATDLLSVTIASVVFAIGFTPVIALTTGLIVSAAPPEQAGAAAALSETGAELGGALGVALLGSLATAVYRFAISDLGVGEAPNAVITAAHSTLAAALAAAAEMPSTAADAVVAAARGAFLDALHAVAIASLVGMAASLGIARLLRPPRRA